MSIELGQHIIPLLCLILAAISFPTLAPRVLWRDQILISLIGVSSFILGLCRSRICYHFFEMLPVYKITLISSVVTIWLVSIYSIGTKSKNQKRLSNLATLAASTLVLLISIQNDLLETASVGKLWFHVAPIFMLTSIYCVFQKQARNIPLKLGLIILFFANLNDNLNDLRIIFTFPMLQIGLGSFITLLILNQTIRLKKSWESFFKKEIELESETKLGRQSVQLAHDIRSPLEALKSTKESLSEISEIDRNMILKAINRIEDIAHQLLQMRKSSENKSNNGTHILTEVEWIVEEKRLQYRAYQDLQIKMNYGPNTYPLFSKMCPTSFKRVISNLISNSAEATRFSGEVTISIREVSDGIEIVIADNGPGFDLSFRENYFKNGFTTNKHGNGLGLSNAKAEIENAGGRIHISNDNGAKVHVILKKTLPPTHFVSEINLTGIDKVIILDDDESIHELWTKKLELQNLIMEHLYSPNEFLKKYNDLPMSTLLLSDYDLTHKRLNGIDCIKNLKAEKNSILVTSMADEENLIKEATCTGFKILSKKFLSLAPLVHNKKHLVLIDDDELIRMSWNKSGKKFGIQVSAFSTIDDFIKESSRFGAATPIYVDSNLGNGIKGEVDSERIYKLGFTEISLATGYSIENLNIPYWISSVKGKSFPCCNE